MNPDRGVIYVALEHFLQHLYPRALRMEERLQAGERLSDSDLEHVLEQLEGLRQLAPLIERHPEHRDIATGVMELYARIARRARDNESGQAKE